MQSIDCKEVTGKIFETNDLVHQSGDEFREVERHSFGCSLPASTRTYLFGKDRCKQSYRSRLRFRVVEQPLELLNKSCNVKTIYETVVYVHQDRHRLTSVASSSMDRDFAG